MIEYSPFHIVSLLDGLTNDYLERCITKKYYDFYYASNFQDQEQILFWLNKLVQKPEPNSRKYQLVQESLRQIISSKSVILEDIVLPGIEQIENIDEWFVAYQAFLFALWGYLFDEPYEPADLSKYIERVDMEFINMPNNPEQWKEAVYKTH